MGSTVGIGRAVCKTTVADCVEAVARSRNTHEVLFPRRQSLELKLMSALALELERRYSKDRILDVLNQIYFGLARTASRPAARSTRKAVSEITA